MIVTILPEREGPMELNRAVAENIKRIRKTKKLSMERLSQEAGVSRSMLGQIERGEANPSVALLGKLAAALKVPADVLLENANVALTPGTAFCAEGYCRISYATSMEQIDKGVDRIEHFVNNLV